MNAYPIGGLDAMSAYPISGLERKPFAIYLADLGRSLWASSEAPYMTGERRDS
jgi:hypothetical protein